MSDPLQKRRRRSRLMTYGAVAAALGLTAAGVGVAQAAATPAPLSLVAATGQVTAERYEDDGESYLSLDLGLHVIAGKDPLEIWAKRTGYDKPIKAERVVVKNGKKTKVTVPAELVPDFNGLKDFTTISIADPAGTVVKEYKTPFCGNGYSSARTRPDAPAANPYPQGCGGYNPFTLGAVWGVQAGWDARVDDYPVYDPDAESFDLPVGQYTATATVNPVYQKLFGIPQAQSTAQVGVTVVEGDTDRGGLARIKAADAGQAAAAPDEHSIHDAEGDAKRQVSSYVNELRAPAKRPTPLKAAPSGGPRPDLRSLPAWEIALEQEDGKWYVNFGATVWNAGTSPLLVDGFRRTGTELMDAYQYFFDAKGNQVGSRPAGTMEWDNREGHLHWHFTDFAQYNLLDSTQKLSVRSGKEAFCLANTDAVDFTIAGAKWRPENTDLSTSCGANTTIAVREVLDIGNGDTYSQYRPGQSFEVTDLPNGTYYIQVLANPEKKLAELDTTNNSALRQIILGGTPEARTLTVPPVHGIKG
ncbi:lysyl oxidase family protein [Actinoplanes sp. TRM 88003]|uniref:Lysyl oxidase family protein n=1 Tax=Paractinoplanes aksuensis TaxID=2939490 RepID=A0ABT1DLI1_9ACTN|nr:lysyl oxidase family protein [Actinoplanes aksuensis]MCO8271664.1 lysyl oxidase family protein [Actinoplanes aksuensis]